MCVCGGGGGVGKVWWSKFGGNFKSFKLELAQGAIRPVGLITCNIFVVTTCWLHLY